MKKCVLFDCCVGPEDTDKTAHILFSVMYMYLRLGI